MQKFKEEIEAQFACHLEEHSFWKSLATESPAGFRAIRKTLLAPGKQLRPLLFCAACRAVGREPLPDLMPVALALELAHAFILVHDDIIDRSDERRGAPTLPKRVEGLFAKKPADGFRGSDFALVTGDLLYTLAIESLLQADASDAQKTEAVRLFTRAALDTGRGALLEMRVAQTPLTELTTADIEKIYALKTGSYTFALPLQLAAVFSNRMADDSKTSCRTGFSGIPESLCPELHTLPNTGSASYKREEYGSSVFRDIGKYAGVAFQLLNDQSNLADDLRDDRRTWALVYAGSKEALANADTLTAVKKVQEWHTLQALDLVRDVPEVRDFLSRVLRPSDSFTES